MIRSLAPWLRAVVVALPIAGSLACGTGDRAGRGGTRAVVLVTVEHWANDPRVGDAPPYAELENAGFRRAPDAMTACPQTVPAVAALMSGSGPDRIGVRDDFHTPLAEDVPVVAGRLAAAGWRTAAFVGNPHLGRDSGLGRGFEVFDAPPPFIMYGPHRRHPPLREPEQLVANALSWLDSAPDDAAGAFAWLHLSGPTWTPPNDEAPDPGTVPSPAAALDALVTGLRERERLEDVAVWIAGVSGPLDETAEGSGYLLNPRVLKAPLLHHPGPAGVTLPADGRVWLPDLAGLLLASAGLDGRIGETLSPGERRERLAWTWVAALEMGWWPAVAVEAGGRLMVSDEGPGTSTIWAWSTVERLDEPAPEDLVAAAGDRRPDPSTRVSPVREIPRELRDALAAGALDPPQEAGRPNGTERDARMASLAETLRARRLIAAGARAPTLSAYRSARAADPDNRAAALEMGQLLSLNRPARSRPLLEAARELDPFEPEVWHGIGHLAFTEKQYRAADAALRLSAHLRPASADLLYDLACSSALLEKIRESADYLERAWNAGFRNVEHIQNDPDLRNLRADPRFAEFMRRVVQ